MAGAGRAGTELMSVSIIAGPAADAVVSGLRDSDRKRFAIFEQGANTKPEEIVVQLRTIAEKGETDHLLIQCESTRPLMAYAFLLVDELADVAQLTCAAFAIDAGTLLDALLDRKPISVSASFIAEQMEFASDIFLAGANGSDLELAQSIINTLNPSARISSRSEVECGTAFDFEQAINGAGWRKVLDHGYSSTGDNVTAFAYCDRRPFHPERFATLLQKGLSGVFRAKGFFWLATRMDEVGGLNLAGSELQCSSAGHWWAARDAQTRDSEMPARTRKEWREPFGDRRQSFAVMAMNVSQDTLQNQLDSCLLTDDEMAGGEKSWSAFTDPFPSWAHAHVHHHDHDCDHDHDSHEHDCCG